MLLLLRDHIDDNKKRFSLFFLISKMHLLDDHRVSATYKNTMFVKKLQTIQACMQLCDDYASVCHDATTLTFYNMEQVFYPLKAYITEYIVDLVVGMPTLMLNHTLASIIDLIKINANYASSDKTTNFDHMSISSHISRLFADNCECIEDAGVMSQLLISYDNICTNIDLQA